MALERYETSCMSLCGEIEDTMQSLRGKAGADDDDGVVRSDGAAMLAVVPRMPHRSAGPLGCLAMPSPPRTHRPYDRSYRQTLLRAWRPR